MSLHAAQRIRMDILGALKSLEEERDAVVARMAMLQAPPYALDAESQEVREAKVGSFSSPPSFARALTSLCGATGACGGCGEAH